MDCHLFNSAALLFVNLRRPCARLSDVCNFVQSLPIFKMSLTNVASVGSVFNDTRKVKVLSLPETIKEKSTFRAMAPSSGVNRELKICNAAARRRAFKTKNIFIEDNTYE